MAYREDGTEVTHADALLAWADAAYRELKQVAQTYNGIVRYAALAESVQRETGISTRMLMPNWIGAVLERVAEIAVDAGGPPLTSLCVRADGTIGDGYDRAPRFVDGSTNRDLEERAAEDRLLCYRRFALDLPPDGGRPELTPEVRARRERLAQAGGLERTIEQGTLSVEDSYRFKTHLEVARLFGLKYRGHQRATIRLDDATEVWFPKMYSNDDWVNTLSPDGALITMQPRPGGQYGDVMTSRTVREYVITFGQVREGAGVHYKFLGVFEGVASLSDTSRWVYQRVSDTVTFDGTGGYSFEPNRKLRPQDDLVAEAADADPRLVAAYEEQLEAGLYTVEDVAGTSKVRGSAQRVFAKQVKENYGWECAVTGIRTRQFLVASHIVPWAVDNSIRLDPRNGICLSTLVDRAFDGGFLSITPAGRTAVRWDRVTDDPILKVELSKIDDVEVRRPSTGSPNPAHLARRTELGY